MNKPRKAIVSVKGTDIKVLAHKAQDYISLTDIARYKDAERTDYLISNWLRNRNTIEFLGIWEALNNPRFNPIEFDGIRKLAGLNSFILTAKQWGDRTGAIGLISKPGRYGGTYAHKDIAFEFASWISAEFKLYLIKEFQRLKDSENDRLRLDWNLQRTLAKVNYRIHTDAIRDALLPAAVTKAQATIVYANEADLLNVALFGQTAKQWRDAHPDADGNIRDQATLEQLVVLSNLETVQATLWQMSCGVRPASILPVHGHERCTSIGQRLRATITGHDYGLRLGITIGNLSSFFVLVHLLVHPNLFRFQDPTAPFRLNLVVAPFG